MMMQWLVGWLEKQLLFSLKSNQIRRCDQDCRAVQAGCFL